MTTQHDDWYRRMLAAGWRPVTDILGGIASWRYTRKDGTTVTVSNEKALQFVDGNDTPPPF